MYVERIEYAGFDDLHPDGHSEGSVALVGHDRRIAVTLTLPRRVEMANSHHRLLLMARAIRQAQRMPEFRGSNRLRFAPGLLPRELQPDNSPKS